MKKGFSSFFFYVMYGYMSSVNETSDGSGKCTGEVILFKLCRGCVLYVSLYVTCLAL